MKASLACLAMLSVLCVASATEPTWPGEPSGAAQRRLTNNPDPRRFIVKFKDNRISTAQARISTISSAGAEGIMDMPHLNMCAVRCANNAARNALRNNPNVESVERDYARYPLHLRGEKRNLATIANWAYDSVLDNPITLANPTTVCVIDSGLYVQHEEFVNVDKTGVDSPGLPWAEDRCSHGTHVAGTIAADATNNEGISGMANLRLRIVRVFDNDCDWTYTSSLIAAMDNCVTDSNVKVISMSLGGGGRSNSEENAINGYVAAGIAVVAASGNSGRSGYSYPASYPNAISVGAHDSNGNIASFSTHNDRVDIAAPGVGVPSAVFGNGGDDYDDYSGTSMATPHVAGCAGILFSEVPTATLAQVEAAMYDTAEDGGSAGRDNYFGNGRLKCTAALEELRRVVTPPTQPDPVTAATATNDGPYGASVSWSHPGTDVTRFAVTVTVDGTTYSTLSEPASSRTASIANLPPSASVTFTIVAYNGNVASDNNPTTSAIMTAPAPPSGLAISNEALDSLTLSWTQAAGTTYTVQRDGSSISGTTSPLVDTGLATDTEYTYTVQATANGMTSSGSTVTGRTLPNPPADVDESSLQAAAAASGTEVTLSWAAVPSADSYAVSRSSPTLAAAASFTTEDTTFVDATASPDTTYTYDVTAVNRGGSSANAASVTVSTPEVCAERSPSLAFNTPVVVDCSAAGSTATVDIDIRNEDTAVCTASSFSMAASAGDDDDSEDVIVAFAGGNDLGSGEAAELKITFKTDNYPGESRLYLINLTTGETLLSETFTENEKRYTYRETLHPGNDYQFKLTDSYGDGVCCDYGRGFFRLELNGERIFSGRKFEYEAAFTIGADMLVGDDTGSYIDAVTLAPGAVETRQLTVTVPGAHSPGETFSVGVFGFRGEFSELDDADNEATLQVLCALPDPPVAPTSVIAALGTPDYSTVEVTWVHSGDAATTFRVEFKATADSDWTEADGSPMSVSTATIANLAPETEYAVRVTSLLNAQEAGPVEGNTVTTGTAPPAPVTGLTATASATGVSLSWTLGAIAGNAPTSHIVTRDGSALTPAGATDTTYDDTTAADDTTYTYTVAPTNAAGTAAPASVTVSTQPGAPTGSLATGTPSWSVLTATWAPASASGTHTGFIVEVKASSDATYTAVAGSPFASTATTTDVTGLARNTEYNVRVTAVNGALASDELVLTASTTIAPPSAPSTPTVTNLAGLQIELAWTLGAIDNNDPDSVFVERYDENGSLEFTSADLGSSATSYTDTGVSPETTYTYVIRVANSVGSASSAATDDITTPAVCVRGTPVVTVNVDQTKPATTSCAKVITFDLTVTVTNTDSAVCPPSTFTVTPDMLATSLGVCSSVSTTTTPGADVDEFSLRITGDANGDLLFFGAQAASADLTVCGESSVTATLLDSADDGMAGGTFQFSIDGVATPVPAVDTSLASSSGYGVTAPLSSTRSLSMAPGATTDVVFELRTTASPATQGPVQLSAAATNEDSSLSSPQVGRAGFLSCVAQV